MTLYVAEAAHLWLISRRMPALNAPCDLVRIGSIGLLRLRDPSHAHLPHPFAPPTPRFWEQRRVRNGDVLFHQVNDADGCAILHRVVDATVRILAHQPTLHQHVGLDDPDPALTGMLWELSAMLAERAHVLTVIDELVTARDDLPAGAAPLPGTDERLALGHARLAELSEVIGLYADHVEVLASRVTDFVEQQATVDRYHSALRNTEFLIDPDAGPNLAPSAAADRTERITAILDAYRELIDDRPADDRGPA